MQRMGRLNRRLENPDGASCLVYDYDGMDGRPYRRADLKAARDVVRKLAEERPVLSQRDLKDALDEIPEAVDDIKFHSAWLRRRVGKQTGILALRAMPPYRFCWRNTRTTSASGIKEIGKSLAVKEWLVPILQDKKWNPRPSQDQRLPASVRRGIRPRKKARDEQQGKEG